MSDVKRTGVAGLVITAVVFVGILSSEGYTENTVIPVKGDVPTNGFGTTAGVKMGDKTTPVKAVQRALLDVTAYDAVLKRCITAPLSQAEYDVYLDFAYNIGPDNFCKSGIAKKINARQYGPACDGILEWKFVKGHDCSAKGDKVCSGLWVRRLAAHKACVAAQ